ncbi:MAG: hypothetical protein V4692_05485, partial [Bdellovibrionota bacterium]
IPVNPMTSEGPCGSLHYWENSHSEKPTSSTPDVPKITKEHAYDVFTHPLSGCAFIRVLEAHQQACQGPGCQVKFGDLFHPPRWNGHKSHGKRTCVDIEPIRNASGGYDFKRTSAFIALLRRAGAEQKALYFNPTGHGTVQAPGHD